MIELFLILFIIFKLLVSHFWMYIGLKKCSEEIGWWRNM